MATRIKMKKIDIDITYYFYFIVKCLFLLFLTLKVMLSNHPIQMITMILSTFVLLKYAEKKLMMTAWAPPSGDIDSFLTNNRTTTGRRTIIERNNNDRTLVCVGDSITCGNVSANYVEKVKNQLHNDDAQYRWNVVNAGKNSITTYEVLRSIDEVIECHPDYVTILIGTNDTKAMVSTEWKEETELVCKGKINLETFESNLTRIVIRLLERTNAIVAVCTIPPMGEDLSSEANSVYVLESNKIIANVVANRKKKEPMRIFLLDTNHELKLKIITESESCHHRFLRLFYPDPKHFIFYMRWMYVLHRVFGLSWNLSSKLVLVFTYNVVSYSIIYLYYGHLNYFYLLCPD